MSFLDIEPKSELEFHGPFNEIVSSEIVVKNFSKKTVGFKVKTTAPKQYCVRPNCGYVEPGKSVVITIMLQPIDPSANEKLKHKFLIQYMELNSPLPENPELVWKTVNKEDISEQKLRCIFVTNQEFDERTDKLVNKADGSKFENHNLTANKLEEKPTTRSYQIFAGVVVVLSVLVAVFIGKFVLA